MRHRLLVILTLSLTAAAVAQDTADAPAANPARPTVSTPATLTPVGYFQFESGMLAAWRSPDVSSQTSLNEVVKFTLSNRLELLSAFEPYAHSDADQQILRGSGDIVVGAQGLVHRGERAVPSVAVAYLRRAYAGNAPDLDIGSFRNSMELLFSADAKGFHCDTNYIFNEVVEGAHRAQFGQTLSISHTLSSKFGITGEVWHYTQPFLHGRTVGNLWAMNYNARSNLVFDAGFNRGLTSTSTRWQVFAGFTYLLPHRLPIPQLLR